MATTYPAELPPELPASYSYQPPEIYNSERKVFQELKKQLPDEYIVFHNRNLPYKGGARSPFERKIDFLIVKKDCGLLALEVKGGKVFLDHNNHLQQTLRGHKGTKRIKPIEQASLQVHQLLKAFEAHTKKHFISKNATAVCAIFPDTVKRDYYGKNITSSTGELIFKDDISNLSKIISAYFDGIPGPFPLFVYEELLRLLIKNEEIEEIFTEIENEASSETPITKEKYPTSSQKTISTIAELYSFDEIEDLINSEYNYDYNRNVYKNKLYTNRKHEALYNRRFEIGAFLILIIALLTLFYKLAHYH